MTVSKTLPVNITYYWSVIKSVYGKEASFTRAANTMLNDLMTTLAQERFTIDQRTIPVTLSSMFRLMSISTLVHLDDEDALSDADKVYLRDNRVITKHYDTSLGFTGAFMYTPDAPVKSIATLADRFIEPDILYTKGVEYECDMEDGDIKFNINPVKSSPFKTQSVITPPEHGEDLEIETIVYVATQVDRKNGPLYTDYGCLVYHSDVKAGEQERQYRLKISSLFNLYYHGNTKSALNAAMNTLLGMPVTLYDGEVIQHITTEPTIYIVRTDRETYVLDRTIPINEALLAGGTRLPVFTPFHTLVEISEGMDNAPVSLTPSLYRVAPHAVHHLTPSSLAELFSGTLNLTTKHPFNWKYYNLKNDKGNATVVADLNPLTAAPGDYWLVYPASNILTVPQPPAYGGGSITYVKGDIAYYSEESHRYEKYRSLDYEGSASPGTVPINYGTYHVFSTGGILSIRDYETGELILWTDVHLDALPEYDSTQALTFDFFSEYESHAETNVFDTVTGDYKLQADRSTILDYNAIVYERLISAVYTTITVTPHVPVTTQVIEEIENMIAEIIPHWTIYEVVFVV